MQRTCQSLPRQIRYEATYHALTFMETRVRVLALWSTSGGGSIHRVQDWLGDGTLSQSMQPKQATVTPPHLTQ